ncbi:hypothetical protein GGR95_002861 [Sulfitobacter undariae]|uniref:Uncharacterized protein n=1 Tax=Sulfitobacter undariae TaxID=1563671 RepID=A0A7W6H2U6_9RHOB|nr:hypothetical protein [Sulfitobacter undariae]MBB3995209.1 hypothetical protein [Sulfitobacter undariae]
MADNQHPQKPAQTPKAEEAARKQARLSQALKANMARRKGQARARAADAEEGAHTGKAQIAQQKDS